MSRILTFITNPLAYGGEGGHCAMSPLDPKKTKCINSIRQCILSVFGSVYQNV